MDKNKNIVLFVNDSYFSYLLAKKMIESNHKKISLIIFSKSTVSSTRKILDIYKKVTKEYFLYRVFIQILSKTFYRKQSLEFLANTYKIRKCYVKNSYDLKDKIDKNSVAFAFNFDLIIKKDVLSKFENGIYNIHASKLPKDKGISPVLWAFARGDEAIWTTIYKMNEGVDSGPIVKQVQILVDQNDTSFSLYRKVCIESGRVLNDIVNLILTKQIILLEQSSEVKSNYFSWPDKKFSLMMKKSNRKLIKIKDFLIKN